MYTVKKLSELANVSVRTLHYYDEIELLTPSKVGANGYRYYDDAALLRLQQILLYRDMGMELGQIKDVLDDPTFDLLSSLETHRARLEERITHMQRLADTVDQTIRHLRGEREMSKRQMFQGFSEEKQKQYERVARLEYGPDKVNESIRRWSSYSDAQKQAIGLEGQQVYNDLVDALEAGKSPLDADVQAILPRWHQHIHYFYEPTLDILRGLGTMYHDHPEFAANFRKLHPDLPSYLKDAITQYVDDLETAEIVRMLAEDEGGLSAEA